MEKSWKNFWTTGKVEDYLSYRSAVSENGKEETFHAENTRFPGNSGESKRQEGRESTWDNRLL